MAKAKAKVASTLSTEDVYFEIWKHHQQVHFNLLMQIFGLKQDEANAVLRPLLNELIDVGKITSFSKGLKFRAVDSLQDLMVGQIIPGPPNKSYDIFQPTEWPFRDKPVPHIRIKKGSPKLWPYLVHIRRSGPNLYAKAIAEITPQHPPQIHGRVIDTVEGLKLVPLFHRFHTKFKITGSDRPALNEGDIVIAKIDPMRGSVHVIDYDLDELPLHKYSQIILKARGLAPDFNVIALDEANAICARHRPAATIDYRDLPFAQDDGRMGPETRVDYRDLPFMTVDGPHARDFDDAIVWEPDTDLGNEDGWRLYVAIADVSAELHQDVDGHLSRLDAEAYDRGASVYFPDGVVPMLPPMLSNDRFSLVPNQERLAFMCEMKISAQGDVLGHCFRPGVIESRARMTYGALDDVMAHGLMIPGLPDDLSENFLMADRILPESGVFQDRLHLGLPTTKINVQDNRAIIQVGGERSAEIIANMMILTNAAAASHDCGLYRNLSVPDSVQMENLSAHIHDINKRRVVSGKAPYPLWYSSAFLRATDWLQSLIAASAYEDDRQQVRTLITRHLPKARFGFLSQGHFALGMTAGNPFQEYTFFTSPIRRFPDVVVHRAIKRDLGLMRERAAQHFVPGAISQQDAEDHFNARSRGAEKAQKDAENLCAMHLLRTHIGQRRGGVICEIKDNGVVVQLFDPPARGFLEMKPLQPSESRGVRQTMKAHFSSVAVKVGDEMEVYIARVDPVAGKLEFSLLPVPTKRPTADVLRMLGTVRETAYVPA